ncbi:MAG: winged helix-turn-helix domain-containing protein [Actinomycetota bacterium]
MITLSIQDARRLAVTAQALNEPGLGSVVDVVERLGRLQMDPIAAVARSERLVLWTRLGAFDAAELDRALFSDGALFEYRAFILPMRDFPLHRETMRRYARAVRAGGSARARLVGEWITGNAAFRRYVLDRLRTDGPLRSRDIEDRAVVPWRTRGWNDDKNVGRMLEILWALGEVATVGRDRAERIWDLAERRYPLDRARLSPAEAARLEVESDLRTHGIARPGSLGVGFGLPAPGRERAMGRLERDGVAVPVRVDGLAGRFLAHAPTLDQGFLPRTTLLSPFDALVADRKRTEELFGFRFRLEIYVPPQQREFGYYVLPILHGDRVIGRIDPTYMRTERRLDVRAVYAEPDAPPDAGPAVAGAIVELAKWLGAEDVRFGRRMPSAWRTALAAAARVDRAS